MNTSSCQQWCQKYGVSTGLLILRVLLGILFVTSGWAKFGNMDMFSGMVASMKIPGAGVLAWVAALTEFLGGLALIAGFGVRVAGALLAVVMMVAFFGAHAGSLQQGMAAFAAFAGVSALAFTGAGAFSVMCWFCKGKKEGMCCQAGEGMAEKSCCKK